jgi:uncharacterized repeat protein (TIGR01451 family)
MPQVKTAMLRAAAVVSVTVGIFGVVGVGAASATVPALSAAVLAEPKHLPPGGVGTLVVQVTNLGDATAAGNVSPVVVEDSLPVGLEATAIAGEGAECELASLRCEYSGLIVPFEGFRIEIAVKVSGSASGELTNEVSVGGGGAIVTRSREKLDVSSEPASSGVEKASLVASNENGSIDTLAGSHPFQLTTTIVPDASSTKDLNVELPPGLVGNTNVVAQCTTPEFEAILPNGLDSCPADTAIGVAAAYLGGSPYPTTVPLFNLVPGPGEPARFGFEVQHIPVAIDTSVRTGRDYGVVASISNVPELLGFDEGRVTFWGVPADPAHNQQRGWNCLYKDLGEGENACEIPESPPQVPFLTLPTSCTGPAGMAVMVRADSWSHPNPELPEVASYAPDQGLQGCNRLRFEPLVSVAPDSQEAATPTGLSVVVREPQEGALNAAGLAPSDVKTVSVTLPKGVLVSPSAANGLSSCGLGEVGYKETNQAGVAEFDASPVTCPAAAKLATVKIRTPLLPNALEGAVYLASPQNYAHGPKENPFESLIAMYLVAEDPVSRVLVKLAGKVVASSSGQLTATFENPQVPYEEAEVHFFGSDRAPLSTPASCGSYTTDASITPWSGTEAVSPSSFFEILVGSDGSGTAGCVSPQPFAPGFVAGSTNLQAGAFTPFSMTLTRPDADQTLSRIEMRMPPGLLGSLAKVALCPEPQASKGECGEASLIGSTVVSAGLGGDPYTVTGGKVYITTGYGGAPYGLTIVNPAQAGPFILEEGRPVIVRAAVFVDPHTAALRIVSDPLPTILDGIPLQIQHVNVSIERLGGFTFNPTNCSAMSIGATLTSSEGATATALTPFQVTNCATLAFKPRLSASTSGQTSKAYGASLAVKLTYPAGPYDANIKAVKVDLPKQLPSRLSTLQKACTAAQFESNPAGCPAASIVGHAKALTPLLPVPLEGPAYFVSHGGEAFPSLIIVLQGYGITIDLVGTTQIKKGITSSTFATVPDAPVGSFELTLPEGKDSALAAYGNLCKSKLAMPTAYLAQNGAEIHTSTPITASKCPSSHKRAKKGKKKAKK